MGVLWLPEIIQPSIDSVVFFGKHGTSQNKGGSAETHALEGTPHKRWPKLLPCAKSCFSGALTFCFGEAVSLSDAQAPALAAV